MPDIMLPPVAAAEDRTLFFFLRLLVKARKTNDMVLVVVVCHEGKFEFRTNNNNVVQSVCSSGSEMLFTPTP